MRWYHPLGLLQRVNITVVLLAYVASAGVDNPHNFLISCLTRIHDALACHDTVALGSNDAVCLILHDAEFLAKRWTLRDWVAVRQQCILHHLH